MAQQHNQLTRGHVFPFALLLAASLTFPLASHAVERFETPVNFNVSPTGAANFNIPIEVPPGTAGMAPSLSLNYSSQGGNGLLGMGWSLSGLPSIYRCGRTIIQDGVIDTVNYNSNDRYCMDGQRLVAVANASGVKGVYGANLTEYRTERESFTKVVSYGIAGSGPLYFKAWTKAGQIVEFGNTTDSRIEAQGKADVRVYAANKISDTVGNYLTISYTEDGITKRIPNANGDYAPLRIDYTGNTAAALAPYNSVRFAYKIRSDITPMYQGGSVIKPRLLLTNVRTYAKVGTMDTLAKDYRVAYSLSPSTQRSRADTITECATGGSCLPAMSMQWTNGINSFDTPQAWLVPSTAFPQVYNTSNQQYAVDFNGDGKADFMWNINGKWNVALSNGNGFNTPQAWLAPSTAFPQVYNASNQQYAVDFNGDGKADFMWNINGKWNVALSNGNGFNTPQAWLAPSTAFPQVYNTSNRQYAVDFNGDGKADFMWNINGKWNVALNKGLFPDLLTSLTTGLGSTTSLVYKPLTDNSIYAKGSGAVYPYVDIQAPLYVVSTATTPDGIGGLRSTNYQYFGAKSHLTGGGFLGFFRVIATDSLTGIKTSTSFRQDYPYQGLPTTTTQTQANGWKLKQVTNTWGFTTYADTILPIATAKGSKHHFAAITAVREETWGLSGEELPQVNTNTTYDAYGNAKIIITTTTSDGFSKTVTNTYAPPDLAKWFLGQLTRATVASTANAATLTRTSAFTYNAVNGLLLTETIEPDSANLKLTTTYTYDTFGNKKTATVSGTGIVNRPSTTTYDTQGRFPISASNALGHAETRVFDERFGTVTKVTGPNNLTSNFAFDGWGRPTDENGPDGVVTNTTRGLCVGGCPANAAYYVTVTKSGTPTVTAYFDKFNRELRRSSPGFDGRLIYKDTEYDNLGRVSRASRPYYAGDMIYYTSYDYDLELNRLKSETDAQGKTSYFDYYGLTTTSTNALGQKRISVKNSQGQLVSVTDALNNVIRYSYDPFGNLLTTTDPAGNVTRLTYDLRGRKTGMNDPDMGVWSYSYNVLGELLTQTDAKLQVTTNTYDVLGRMTRRAEPDLITTWTYDTAIKGVGKLATMATDNGQTRSFIYDAYGRLLTTSNTIGATTLNMIVTYDNLGRFNTQTNPAGLVVQNVYNTNGYLAQIKNAQTLQVYWTANALSADGQLSDGIFGNGVVESRTIDTLGRTTAVTAAHTLGAVNALNYIYDALGDLELRTDTIHSLTESFGYDALNRLTSASSSNPSQPAKSIQYDSLGNITYKSDTGTYSYNPGGAGSVRPHAVTAVSGAWNASFQYDANGNMTTSADRTLTYTSFNLPTTITQNNQTTTLLYGADHERIKQTDPDGKVTLTLNPRLDLGAHYDQITHPSGVVEKISYLYAGSRPIGMVASNAQGQSGVTTLRYFHVDAQGSIVAITSGDTANAGAVIERLSYDAWGKRRNPDGTDSNVNIHPQTTDHGYTGHMHLDEVGLIHMNGRIYDPRLGRFMQADPYIQSPGNLQSFNRYSYVQNNPFMYTDPSGYFSLKGAIKSFTTNVIKAVGNIPYVGGIAQIGLLTTQFGWAYGWSTGDWKSVGQAHVTGGIIAATYWAGGAAWGNFAGATGAGVGATAYATAAGIYVAESAAISYASSYAIAKVYGASDAEARRGALLAGKRGALMAGMRVGYRAAVGWDADPSPGKTDPNNTTYDPDKFPAGQKGTNVSGFNTIDGHDAAWCQTNDCSQLRPGFAEQGGSLSRFINGTPGGAAISHLDDLFNNSLPPILGDSIWFKAFTIPTAIVITAGALIPAPLTVVSGIQQKY